MQVASAAAYRVCRRREAGSVRVVLLETDPNIKRKLQMVIEEDQTYAVVASTDSWIECESLLEQYVPELLVAGSGQIPAGFMFETSGFPVVLHLGTESHYDQSAIDRVYGEVRRELVRIRHEIYVRKACQLSMLLDRYFAGLNSLSYLASIQICQAGTMAEIAIDHIQVIEAAGNYVRIYSSGKEVGTLRETISGLQAKLDPQIFVRVHRSYIVNLNHVFLLLSGEAPALLVTNSKQPIPIGPNYRNEVLHIFDAREKLIA